MKPRYIQVDLEIQADFDLRKLVKAFGDSVSVLHCGLGGSTPFMASIEMSPYSRSLNKTLRLFCEAIESLPPKGKELWQKAGKRVFDIGFDSGDVGRFVSLTIHPSLYARIAALGATIAVTIYPVPPPLTRRKPQ